MNDLRFHCGSRERPPAACCRGARAGRICSRTGDAGTAFPSALFLTQPHALHLQTDLQFERKSVLS